MVKRFNRLTEVVTIIAAILLSASGLSCSPRGYSGPVDSIVVAWSPFEQEALLWIAEDQNFFSQKGLDVTLRKYETGAGSLDGVLNREADIAVGVTEFPTVRRVFEKSAVRIIGTAAKSEQQYLVARKDLGIAAVSDLKGKRVGTTFGTIAEFYLARFLELHGVSPREITVVDLRTPAEWENAVADGVVDAILTSQPYVDLASKRLGRDAIVWPAQGGQYVFGLIVSSREWVTGHPDIAGRFIEALEQAEEYAVRNPSGAKAIMRKWLDVDAAFVESAWSRDQFALSLDLSLVLAMEDQARWMMRTNLTTEKTVPNFADYIYEDVLKTVKPEAVNLIR